MSEQHLTPTKTRQRRRCRESKLNQTTASLSTTYHILVIIPFRMDLLWLDTLSLMLKAKRTVIFRRDCNSQTMAPKMGPFFIFFFLFQLFRCSSNWKITQIMEECFRSDGSPCGSQKSGLAFITGSWPGTPGPILILVVNVFDVPFRYYKGKIKLTYIVYLCNVLKCVCCMSLLCLMYWPLVLVDGIFLVQTTCVCCLKRWDSIDT